MAAGTVYQQLLAAVQDYYGAGSDQWLAIAQYGLKADNAAAILKQVPGVSAQVTKDGQVLSYTIDSSIPLNDGGASISAINSNIQSGTAASANTATTKTVGTMVKDAQTGDVNITNKIPKKTGGVAGTAAAVAGTVSTVIAGASIGFSLGKTINAGLSQSDPSFWGRVTATPEEGSVAANWWKAITNAVDKVDPDGKVQNFLNALVGWDNSGNTQAYLSEDAYAYYAYMLSQEGFFDAGAYTNGTGTRPASQGGGTYPIYPASSIDTPPGVGHYVLDTPMMGVASEPNFGGFTGRWGRIAKINYTEEPVNKYSYHSYDRTTGQARDAAYSSADEKLGFGWYLRTMTMSVVRDGVRIYYDELWRSTNDVVSTEPINYVEAWNFPATMVSPPAAQPSVPGTDTQPNAILPDTTGWADPVTGEPNPTAIKQSLESQYPDLYDNAYEVTTIDDDGNEHTTRYLPVPLPDGYDDSKNPTGGETSTQQDPEVDPDSATDDLLRTIIELITLLQVTPESVTDPESETDDADQTTDPNPPDTGDGTTPPVIVPVGSASALWSVYNPTQQAINDLGSWLWSSNFVTQLLQMFNDPMQAIIGLHKTFITPNVGAAQNIRVGYLDSGVSALTVPTQYSTMNCGSVNLAEYFGNVFDYTPYTRVYIYLPFIGFKELDVSQVMRSSIGVVYHGDAYTGACLAEVSVTRDGGAGGVLYTYGGDCAVRYPLSHGSYMGIVNAIASLGVGVAGAALGAGGLGLMGGLSAFQNARLSVEHSGSFDGCSGAMGIKKPYLVVMRPQTAMPANFKHFSGKPSSSLVQIAETSGLIRVRECHVDEIPNATKEEKDMIDKALHDGILVS